ncbi:MAG TPA: TonB-dependent receptor [Hyphomicrobium sp.]|nr:TonB-dependent receptor [Hyphomicrobium sp.]
MSVSRYVLLAGVALSAGFGELASAQEVKTADAGDGEVTLPPVVISAPKEKIAQKPKPAAKKHKPVAVDNEPGGSQASSGGGGSGQAEESAVEASGTEGDASSSAIPGVFTLGQIDMVGGTAVSGEAMRTFSKDTLDKALALAPGVAASNSGGSRNEQLIFVRGFDRWQVPLSIDGIRIYRPADNRIDFSSFLTPDVSELQIAKGYTSVLNGPGGMGGAINLVTKKPQKAVDGEVQGGLAFGTDGQFEGYKTYASLGARQSGYYAQASGIWLDNDSWYLSDDFAPTPVEDGGRRDHSYKENWQVNLKAGLTPNPTDDYSINYQRTTSARGAPYHVNDPVEKQRYWDWPGTVLENVYWLSHTKIGDASFLETKAYYTSYTDKLFSYDDPEQTTQTRPYAFQSFFDDWALGGSVTAGADITTWDTLKVAFHARRDLHGETQSYNLKGKSCGSTAPCFMEPDQTTIEDTYSVALENTFRATSRIDIISGISYDWRNLQKAEDYANNAYVHYELKDSDAFNWQNAVVYRYTDTETLHASVSDRTRFPTIFERFSSRFGGSTSNPGLRPEEATNYEIGWSTAFAPRSLFATAAFYSDVQDIIQPVPIRAPDGTFINQSQNVGSGHYYGAEASIDYAISPQMLVGGNITWVHRDVSNPNNPSFELTGLPEIKGIAYMTYRFTDAWSVTPSVEFASERWTVTADGSLYYKTGAFGLLNFQTEYEFTENTSLMLTARNILDENYILTDGYPEAGRTFYVNMRARF